MHTDQHDRHVPDDPEAEFLAELDAAVSGWPVREGSDLLATATRVRKLAASDSRARLDPMRQQEIWSRIMAREREPRTTTAPIASTEQAAGRRTFRIPRLRAPRAAEHRGRRSVGWLATAVAICLVALLAVPLIRELGTNGRGNAPAQLPAQTRNVQLGSGGAGNVAGASRAMTPGTGGDNSQGLTAPVAAGVGQDMTPPSMATQAVPPADGGILAPPSTVIATMPPNLTVAARVSVADPHALLFQLKQNNGISYGWEDRYRTDATGTRAYHVIPWTPAGDTDLSGSVGGVEIVQDGQGDRPLAGYIVFARPEKAAQRLAEIEQTPGLVMAKTRVDQYDGVIVLNNDRVITIVQVGNVLVIGSAWTDENDWVSTEDDLQAFKWQSLKETISAIAYLDHVVSAYQGHR